ncbi:MAG: hypothetical protein OXB91_14175, partial [Bryobacterales bacterium]|nr:hypothetical protein [Bryobacterales bacterium]
ATAIDSGDFVAVVGGAYQYGIAYLSTWWLGIPLGWLLATGVVLVPIYRAGFFTNAEYLEARFGPGMRLIGALVQIQQRTNVMGNMAFSLFLLLGVITGWGAAAWWLVVGLAVLAAVYTASGGLRTVVATDSLQTVMIVIASGLLWAVVWRGIGGWAALRGRLAAADPELPAQMLSYGGLSDPGTPLALVLFGWIAVHAAYCIVNHSQSMRLLGARSAWDMRAAVVIASAALIAVMWCNVSLGIMSRALYPDLEHVDAAFPQIFVDFLDGPLAGLVLAGVLAACISTYDSIGSALGAVFTRDVYCRFLAPHAQERTTLTVTRVAAVVCVALSFLYIPFLGQGMVAFYLRLSSVAVVPLATVFAVGAWTRAHPRAGIVGMLAGVLCGLVSMLGDRLDWHLPALLTNVWWSYLWAVAVTGGAMAACTIALGPADPAAVRGLTLASCRRGERYRGSGDGWLERSRAAVASQSALPEPAPRRWHPERSTLLLIGAAAAVFFIAFR